MQNTNMNKKYFILKKFGKSFLTSEEVTFIKCGL